MDCKKQMLRKEELQKRIAEREEAKDKVEAGIRRLCFHLQPPVGWLNDPNGLCFYQGCYHVFFQYAPESPEGGLKYWGHFRSADLLNWQYLGVPLLPDTPLDKDGVYSGCGFAEDGMLELFYTGNVKEEGEYDYIYCGRGANVLHVSSLDGIHFSIKELLLTKTDYPADYSCHIRDPKVWREGDAYYMVLGARKKAEVPSQDNDWGTVLLYCSADKKKWKLKKEIMPLQRFGYMWECPDCFTIEGKKVLSFSPQGLAAEEYRFQNTYQSGYLFIQEKEERVNQENFVEWDRGFDFYAPQTFTDDKGRRILIGWAGMIDTDYYNSETVSEGWQHALTVARELHTAKITEADGRERIILTQNPVEEINKLHGKTIFEMMSQDKEVSSQMSIPITCQIYDAEIEFGVTDDKKEILFQNDLQLKYQNGMLELAFLNETGDGRGCRKAMLRELRKVRILKDTSLVEIFMNDGEMVFTTRYYQDELQEDMLELSGGIRSVRIVEMKGWKVL